MAETLPELAELAVIVTAPRVVRAAKEAAVELVERPDPFSQLLMERPLQRLMRTFLPKADWAAIQVTAEMAEQGPQLVA
jgi:hypothetical protein